MVNSGIMLFKWPEVKSRRDTRCLEDRIADGRKLWKHSEMDLKSYARWDDYTRARDEMFEKTYTSFAPWRVAKSTNKKARAPQQFPPICSTPSLTKRRRRRRSHCQNARSTRISRPTTRRCSSLRCFEPSPKSLDAPTRSA